MKYLDLTEDPDGVLLASANEDLGVPGQAASSSAGITDAEAAAQGGASFKLLRTPFICPLSLVTCDSSRT